MTTSATGDTAELPADAGFAADWQAVRGDDAIQFAPVELPDLSDNPGWLSRLLEWLADLLAPVGRALGLSWPIWKWAMLAIGVAIVVALLWYVLRDRIIQRKQSFAEPDGWVPDSGEALALLEEADRLAAEGRYDEATHMLLRRSIDQIDTARPGLLEPSSTAREIAGLPALSDAARSAFAAIAERVERSLFALRSLDGEDWRVARAAYADFALAAPQGSA